MINVLTLARQYAEEVGGQFTDYDHTKAVLVVPLPEGRFQTILVISRTSTISQKELAVLTSKICELDSGLNLQELLQQNLEFDFSKFVIEDNYLKLEASCVASTANEDQLKEMIYEVASVADQLEFKYTGADVH